MAQPCNLTNYASAFAIPPTSFPYFSVSSGVTVSATVFNITNLGNVGYTCGANTFNCSSTAWWINSSTAFIRLNFSAPVTNFTMIFNGTNATEEFYFTPLTGTVTLSNFCPTGYSATGNALLYSNAAASGNIVSINNPTGSTQYTVTHNGVGSGSRISLLDCFVTLSLPLSLPELEGSALQKHNQLRWKSEAAPEQIDYFGIEKSLNGVDFAELTTTAVNTQKTYTALDPEAAQKTYYRIKQLGKDGQFGYSNIVEINNFNTERLVNVYPNPSKNNFYVSIAGDAGERATILVYDILGKLVHQKDITLNGNTTTEIDCMGWSAGTYVVKVNHANTSFAPQRIVIE